MRKDVAGMSEMIIRRAVSSDIESLIDLYGEMEEHARRISSDLMFTLGSRWRELTGRYFVEFSNAEDKLVLVALSRGKIVGFLVAMVTEPLPIFVEREYGSLNDMFVKEEHRGKGLGKRLMETAIEWFKEKKIRRIELRVGASNRDAIAFYESHGFKIRAHTMKKEF